MKRVLITGSEGFLGSKLKEQLRSEENEIWTLDVSGSGPNHFNTNVEEFDNYSDFDEIYHLAAISDPVICEANKDKAWRINVGGTRNILKQLSSDQRLVFTSSSHVYGRGPGLRKENDKRRPDNFYGLTKKVSEDLIEIYSKSEGFDFTIYRLFNVYGPGQPSGFIVPDVIQKARRNKEVVARNPHSKLSLVYADDAIAAISQKLPKSVYNVSNRCSSIKEIYNTICKEFNTPVRISDDAETARSLCGDRRRISEDSEIDWTALEAGLKQVIMTEGYQQE